MSGDVVERNQSFEFKGKTYYRWPIMNGPSGSSTRISDKPFPVVCPCCEQDSNSQAAEIERLTKERDEAMAWAKEQHAAADRYAGRAETAERLLAEARAALEPFAAIADEYSDAEDDEFQVWQDFDVLGATLPLLIFRRARALTNGGE